MKLKNTQLDAKIPLQLNVLPEKHQGERESVCVCVCVRQRNTTRATIIVKNGKAWFEKKTRKYCSY